MLVNNVYCVLCVKVCEVEGEMRELLMEVKKEKAAMEARAQKMTLALHQLQRDFTQ